MLDLMNFVPLVANENNQQRRWMRDCEVIFKKKV